MNRFIQAVTALDLPRVKEMLATEPKWRTWSQPDGKNALHFLCSRPLGEKWNVPARELEPGDPADAAVSLAIARLLIKHGIDINSIHQIADKNCIFPATPVWYAYTRGRNEKLYRHGAKLTGDEGRDTPLAAAVSWKRFEMARWLLKNGADLNTTDERGRTPLQIAVKKKYPPEIISLMKDHGAA
jgi:ankyrin repeat protein